MCSLEAAPGLSKRCARSPPRRPRPLLIPCQPAVTGPEGVRRSYDTFLTGAGQTASADGCVLHGQPAPQPSLPSCRPGRGIAPAVVGTASASRRGRCRSPGLSVNQTSSHRVRVAWCLSTPAWARSGGRWDASCLATEPIFRARVEECDAIFSRYASLVDLSTPCARQKSRRAWPNPGSPTGQFCSAGGINGDVGSLGHRP